MNQLENINQLWKILESSVEQIAKLILTRNWVSLLLLVDAVWIFLFFPDRGIIAKGLNLESETWLAKNYSAIFWVVTLAIFLTALVIAIRKIQVKPSAIPDFTERKAIKGLRAFSQDDAEIFAQLQRERDLRECLESLTSNNFRFGILIGESGVGKSSFLQAGILPQLAKEESCAQGIYIRFSNRDPFETVYQTLVRELKISETPNNQQNLLEIFSLAVVSSDKPLILIFDQFEQFFVHCKQKSDREPFIKGLKNWYLAANPLPIKILISIREDLAGKLFELQEALGYSLNVHSNYYKLNLFSPEEATKVLQVIAQAEKLKFDEGFVRQLTTEELTSREDGLISPVDLQVFASTIEGQDREELQAFNRQAFEKIGGIEGLMKRFLNKTLEARITESEKQAAIKVLLAMTKNLDSNTRAGALTIEDLQQKMQGTLTASKIIEATLWLAHPGVRLLTSVQEDGNTFYELAHERLIPALREIAGKELTSVDKANQLLDRRVNEWLGNGKSSRYLFNWQELRLIRQQKPSLGRGANKKNKEKLLQRSWRRLYRRLVAVAMVLVFGLVAMGWWYSPWGQIQQVRLELPGLSERVSYGYREKAALAFLKNGNLKQASVIFDSISYSNNKAIVLTTIAETIGQIYNFPQAAKSLELELAAAESITGLSDKAQVIITIAKAYSQIENFPQAAQALEKALAVAESIPNSYDNSDEKAEFIITITKAYSQIENFPEAPQFLEKALAAAKSITYYKPKILTAIAETIGQIENFPEAPQFLEKVLTAAESIPNSFDNEYDKAEVLTTIAQAYSQIENCPEAAQSLEKALTAAESITFPSDKARVLTTIAKTYDHIGNCPEAVQSENSLEAVQSLRKALATAESIPNSYDKAQDLTAIVEAINQMEDFPEASQFLEKALAAAESIPNLYNNLYYKTETLIAIMEAYGQIENFPKATQSLEKAFAAAKSIPYYETRVLAQIAETIGQIENFPEASQFLEKVFAATESIPNSDDNLYYKTEALITIAEAYGQIEDFPKATQSLEKAFAAAKSMTYNKTRVLAQIAETIGQIENFPEAPQFWEKVLAAAESIPNSNDEVVLVLTTIAKAYGQRGTFPKAAQSLEKWLVAAESITSPYNKVQVLTTIAETIGQIENFPEAPHFLEKALAAADSLTDSYNKAQVLTTIAETYGKMNKFPEAAQSLKKALAAAESITNSPNKVGRLTAIISIQAKIDRWREAYNTVSLCPNDKCKVESLSLILTAWAEKKHPELREFDKIEARLKAIAKS